MKFGPIFGTIITFFVAAILFVCLFGWGICIGIGLGTIFLLWLLFREYRFENWVKRGCPGDYAYFEWMYCKRTRKRIKKVYKADSYCKISLNDFQKYFAVNPSRYYLQPSWVVFDNDDGSTIIMIFPKKDSFRYFLFRRHYLQSRRMADVINTVQKDIDKAREDAQKQIDKARAALDVDLKI